jgi:hypothetical protein
MPPTGTSAWKLVASFSQLPRLLPDDVLALVQRLVPFLHQVQFLLARQLRIGFLLQLIF